ncbi:hypothetical protein [Streptomyces djakartensis]|uniref:hypothetical protein n=1 Tax=Streptomyces djakartensis TaxID=68193 RepID=UPI0034DE9837
MSTGEYGHAEGAGHLPAGRHRVTGRLGRGGTGVVWKGVDEDGRWANTWWAETDDDGGRDLRGSDVYVEGGDSDAPVPGLPYC